MAVIRITDLSLKTIIGIFDWERKQKQEVLINVEIDFNATKSMKTDNVNDTVDYKIITKEIIRHIEASEYFLIEKMAGEILRIVLSYPKVRKARVRVDKPGALRFARSVSVEVDGKNV